MARKLFAIRLQELVVDSNGDFPGANPSHDDDLGLKNNALIASLTYPRPGAPQVISVKQYDLENGKAATLTVDDEFFDPLLFREDVLDRTVLSVKVTNLDESGKAGKFFLKVFSVVLGAGFTAATSGLGGILGAVVGFGIDTLTGGVSGAGDQHVDVIGEAKLNINVRNFSDKPELITLDLIAPDTITRSGFAFDPQTHQAVQNQVVITTKGQRNGHVILEVSAQTQELATV